MKGKEKMSNVLALETNKYAVRIENFEGPLDLLIHLIDKNKMDIYDIKISEITEQYIEYINKMEEMNLVVTSEFAIMASTLLYLKTKKLLPKHNELEEELTEEELIRRIIEYKKFKDITKNLRENFDIYSNRCYKVAEKIYLPKQEIDEQYEEGIISKIYANLWERTEKKINQNAKNIEKIALVDTYTVYDKVKEMFKILLHKPNFIFNKVYTLQKNNKQEVVTAFSGLLELSRKNKVITEQDEIFGDIKVQKNKKRHL